MSADGTAVTTRRFGTGAPAISKRGEPGHWPTAQDREIERGCPRNLKARGRHAGAGRKTAQALQQPSAETQIADRAKARRNHRRKISSTCRRWLIAVKHASISSAATFGPSSSLVLEQSDVLKPARLLEREASFAFRGTTRSKRLAIHAPLRELGAAARLAVHHSAQQLEGWAA